MAFFNTRNSTFMSFIFCQVVLLLHFLYWCVLFSRCVMSNSLRPPLVGYSMPDLLSSTISWVPSNSCSLVQIIMCLTTYLLEFQLSSSYIHEVLTSLPLCVFWFFLILRKIAFDSGLHFYIRKNFYIRKKVWVFALCNLCIPFLNFFCIGSVSKV